MLNKSEYQSNEPLQSKSYKVSIIFFIDLYQSYSYTDIISCKTLLLRYFAYNIVLYKNFKN